MDDVKKLIILRKEASQLHKNILNDKTRSFAQNYQNIKYEAVEFPKARMDKNLAEMSEMMENQKSLNTFAKKNASETNEIAKRISNMKKTLH